MKSKIVIQVPSKDDLATHQITAAIKERYPTFELSVQVPGHFEVIEVGLIESDPNNVMGVSMSNLMIFTDIQKIIRKFSESSASSQ